MVPKKQKRPDLFTPELEQFHQETAGNLIMTATQNTLETLGSNQDVLSKTDQGLGRRDQLENNNK